MALLIKLIFEATAGRTVRYFADSCRDAVKAQEDLLKRLLSDNAGTSFGRAHNFASIRSIADYRQAVPLGNYDSLFPYIEASMKGIPAQLTTSPPLFFSITSGTTGAPKYIPVTKESRSFKSQTMRVFLAGLYQKHPDVFDGRILTVVSPEVQSYTSSGIPCGSESGYTYRNMPAFLKALYSSPYDVYEIGDYDARYYTLMRIAAGHDIRLMYIINPSTVLLMAQILGVHTRSIITDVRNGTLSHEFTLDDRIRQTIEKELKPDPDRANELEHAIDQERGQLTPEHVWPRLAALCCWRGGNVGYYIEKIAPYFRSDMPIRDIGYLASEHRSSIPLEDNDPSGVLDLNANFYEFVPAEKERPFSNSDIVDLPGLLPGRRYYVVISNHAGLYRYDMDDIVEVTGYYHQSPCIRFVQKGKGTSSFTGEKLYEGQIVDAVAEAFKIRQGRYEFIAAFGQIRNDTPVYIFLVEFDDPYTDEECREFLRILEQSLRTKNVEYAAKRDSLRIAAPVLRIVKKGQFAEYRKRKVEAGRPDSQFKVVRLTTDVSFMDEFTYEREIGTENTQ
ncbi:MAG: GH3 auxin-responsive promoter family protein [Syntrophorhabdaceae bacterium]